MPRGKQRDGGGSSSDDDTPAAAPESWRDRIVDAVLIGTALACAAALYAIAKTVVVYIVCGLAFMSTAAYSLMRASFAESRRSRHAWNAAALATLLLFGYWALTTVFRPPAIKTSIGCGGVKFVNADGMLVDHDPRLVRDEL